ncbi:hypothetical protein ACNUOF_07000 [Clostridium perfringens]|uniref:hypothetical protein n=1 Tax=Clostridium perfringens TaxID=1502 RepID=UPI003AFFA059
MVIYCFCSLFRGILYMNDSWTEKEIRDLEYMVSKKYILKDMSECLEKGKYAITAKMKELNLKSL